MTFGEQLNKYIDEIGASYSKIAKTAGLGASTVARYKRGEREPACDSDNLRRLAAALAFHAEKEGLPLTEVEIFGALRQLLKGSLRISYEAYVNNLNALISALDIKVSSLAKGLSFDPSHISKVLSGQRKPGDVEDFTRRVSSFAARCCTGEKDIAALAELLNCDKERLDSFAKIQNEIADWLGTNTAVQKSDPVGHFLQAMDEFSLDEFISAIHFNDVKLPSAPFHLPTSKTYTSLDGMMKCELDFIKATVLSDSKRDCILYSDMPLEEMAKDEDFPKKWMFGMAMLLKKGLHLHIIHDVHRPFREMMLGLESNLPMYMTGQISPWYLSSKQNDVFTHLLKVSGGAAMEGSAIAGHHSEGKYFLSKSEKDIRFYRQKAERLLQKAKPLMDIYTAQRRESFAGTLRKLLQNGDRTTTSSALPVYTLTAEALRDILKRNKIAEKDAGEIEAFRQNSREAFEEYLSHQRLILTVSEPSREQFEKAPVNLALSEIFFSTDVPYSYEEYAAHLELTKKFAAEHPNMTLKTDPAPVFRNISYSIIGSKQVVVSKNKYPTIHFIIHHPKMAQAFLNFIPPLSADEGGE